MRSTSRFLQLLVFALTTVMLTATACKKEEPAAPPPPPPVPAPAPPPPPPPPPPAPTAAAAADGGAPTATAAAAAKADGGATTAAAAKADAGATAVAAAAALAAGGSPAEEAKALFVSRCQVCHGATGKGDGPGAVALTPKPRNYTDKEWQKSVKDDDIAKTILKGGMAVGKSPLMPPNPDLQGKPEVIKELVKVVRGFAK